MTNYVIDIATLGEYANSRWVVHLAIAAESAGWQGLFVWDHLGFALIMLRNGTDLLTVSRLPENSSLAVTQRYLYQIEGDLQEGHRRGSLVDNAFR